MKTPAPADLQRWSDELARNPASLAFLPLARAYRRMGRTQLALRLCTRGLEAHPGSVEAHALLALLYLELGERERAADEWSVVLRLKPGNFEALRGMGFRYLEQDDIPHARQHLERAALIRPDDTAVQEALRLLRQRETVATKPETVETAPVLELEEAVWTPESLDESVQPAPEPERVPEAAPADVTDPAHVFDELARGPIRGALLLDRRGLVLAGSLGGNGRPDDLGAILGGAIDEASRTVEYLELGAWRGLLMETQVAVVYVTPLSEDAIVVVAAAPDAPTGWILRSADHAGRIATRFLEAYS